MNTDNALSRSPIHGHLELAHFFHSPTHEEALARLHYLAEQHLRLGILLGEPGSGKSLLLTKFASELRSHQRHIVQLSLLGKDVTESLAEIAAQLHVSLGDSPALPALWRSISDRLKEHKYLQHDTIILLDDIHEASPETLTAICRLAETDPTEEARLTIVAAAHLDSLSKLPARLLERAALRVDVEPWERQDTIDFLIHAVEQLRSMDGSDLSADELLPSQVFTEDAASKLHELSGGLPRRVSQLAQWALLAGAGMGMETVDDETVASAAEELGLLAV